MTCTMKFCKEVAAKPIAYKYYVQTTMNTRDDNFEDLLIQPKFGNLVNRQLKFLLDNIPKGRLTKIWFNDFLSLLVVCLSTNGERA